MFMICIETPELYHIVPYVSNTLNERCNFYDIYNIKMNNPTEFSNLHRTLLKYNWSKCVYNTKSFDDNTGKEKFNELNKKRIDKGQKIYVKNRLDLIKKYVMLPVWEPIQFCLGLNTVNFYDRCLHDGKK